MDQKAANYKIDHIFLMELNFKREVYIDFNGLPIDNKIAIDSQAMDAEQPNIFLVNLNLSLHGIQNDVTVYQMGIKVTGVFSRLGESQLNEETFKKINGPAILFPFVRENISNMALKAGLGNILLPPINFTP
jgi:preprotein translocase subunit SecB